MSNTISATELKNKAADVLNEVIFSGSEMVVERYGKPVVKIVPVKNVRKTKNDLKKALDSTFGAIPDFPDVARERRASRSFFKLAGILSDTEARRLKRIVQEGRQDGSRHKKFLLR